MRNSEIILRFTGFARFTGLIYLVFKDLVHNLSLWKCPISCFGETEELMNFGKMDKDWCCVFYSGIITIQKNILPIEQKNPL